MDTRTDKNMNPKMGRITVCRRGQYLFVSSGWSLQKLRIESGTELISIAPKKNGAWYLNPFALKQLIDPTARTAQ